MKPWSAVLILAILACKPSPAQEERNRYLGAALGNLLQMGKVSDEYGLAAGIWALDPTNRTSQENVATVRQRFLKVQTEAQGLAPPRDFQALHARYLKLQDELKQVGDRYESSIQFKDFRGITDAGARLAKVKIDLNVLIEDYQKQMKEKPAER